MRDLFRLVWRAEPVALLTGVLVVATAVLDAAGAGWNWRTLALVAAQSMLGLIARQNVYAPDTVDEIRLGQ